MHLTKQILAVDTCILINVAKGVYKDMDRILFYLEHINSQPDTSILLPQQFIDEWNRNKEVSIIQPFIRSFRSRLKDYKDISIYFEEEDQKNYIQILDKYKNNESMMLKTITDRIERIDKNIIDRAIKCTPSDNAYRLGVQYSLDCKKPFAKNKNSMGDFIGFYSIIEFLHSYSPNPPCEDFHAYFVTENTEDFSKENGDKNIIHNDLETLLYEKIEFSINIGNTINKITNQMSINEEVINIIQLGELKTCPRCDKNFREKGNGYWGPSLQQGGLQWWLKCPHCDYHFVTDEHFE